MTICGNPNCHVEFVPNRKYQKNCTPLCTRKRYLLSPKGRATTKALRETDQSKATERAYRLSPKGKKNLQLAATKYYLSPKGKARTEAYTKAYTKTEQALTLSRIRKQRRRSLQVGAFVEDVKVHELLEMQGGLCYLCNQPLSADNKHPDPSSLSLDHIIPLSKGGKHSMENCAATHLKCNIIKGSKPVDDVIAVLRATN